MVRPKKAGSAGKKKKHKQAAAIDDAEGELPNGKTTTNDAAGGLQSKKAGAKKVMPEADADTSATKPAPRAKRRRSSVGDGLVQEQKEVPEELAPPAKRSKKKKKATPQQDEVSVQQPEPSPAQTAAAAKDALARTIFVDGVPYEWTKEKVEEYFSKCGSVVELNAAAWQDSGRLRGYAHVTFETEKATKAALALTGSKVGKKGRYLKIEQAKGHSKTVAAPSAAEVEGMRRLFVKNLPYDTNEEELGNLFKKCGNIREIRIPTSFGRVKGFAYIEFAKSEGLQAAVSLSPPPQLRGRKLIMDCDSGKGPRSGFHARPEAFASPFGPKKVDGKGKGKGRGKSKDSDGNPKSKTKLSLL